MLDDYIEQTRHILAGFGGDFHAIRRVEFEQIFQLGLHLKIFSRKNRENSNLFNICSLQIDFVDDWNDRHVALEGHPKIRYRLKSMNSKKVKILEQFGRFVVSLSIVRGVW